MRGFDLSQKDITEGSILRTLVLLATPLIAQNLVLIVQQVIDLFWVGRYSSTAVASIGLAAPVFGLLLVGTTTAPFVGTQILVSQRVGAENIRGAQTAVFNGLLIAVASALVIGGTVFFNADSLLGLVVAVEPTDSGSSVSALAIQYIEVLSIGIIFAAVSDVIEAAFVGWGDSRAVLYVNITSVVVNIGLDPIFIFGYGPVPELGIQGAALATIAGYAAGLFLGIVFVATGRVKRIFSWSAEICFAEIRELLSIGLPQAVQGITRNVGQIIIVAMIFAIAGPPGLAAYTVGSRVSTIAFQIVGGLEQAGQSIVAQNIGAGNPYRARIVVWIGIGIGAAILSGIGIFQWLAAGFITNIFAPEITEQSFSFAVSYLQILALSYPAIGVIPPLKAGFNGVRRTRVSMIATIAQTWLFQLPLAFLGGFGLSLGILSVFWAETVAVITATLCLGLYYRRTNESMYRRAISEVSYSSN
jgi:putative MATE family efflux protein